MKCPDCNSKTIVADSRSKEQEVYRRRVCTSCGKVFHTIEKIDYMGKVNLSVAHKINRKSKRG